MVPEFSHSAHPPHNDRRRPGTVFSSTGRLTPLDRSVYRPRLFGLVFPLSSRGGCRCEFPKIR